MTGMILRMNTMNRKAFQEELARCSGTVTAILPDGTQCEADAVAAASRADRYTPLKLTLKIRQTGDYMRLACFAIGDV